MNERFLLSLCTIDGKNLPQCEKELQNFPSLSVKRKRKKITNGLVELFHQATA